MHVTMPAREWRAITSPIKLVNSRVDVQLVRIDAADGMVTATTNRYTSTLQAIAYGDVVQHGSVCVPIIGLSSILKYCPGASPVTLRLEDGKTHLSTDNVQHVFETHASDAVSPIRKIKIQDRSPIVLSGSEFVRGMKAVSYATATELQRPALSGVHIDPSSSYPTMTSADGYRLARQRIDLVVREKNVAPVIIPKDLIVPAVEMCQQTDSLMEISTDETTLYMTVGRYAITTPLITSRYPDVSRVLPTTHPIANVRLNGRVLANALKRIIKIDVKETYCHVDFSNNELKVIAPRGLIVSLPSTVEGSANIAINPRFFHAAVFGADGDVSVSVYEEANKSLVVESGGYYALVALFAKR